MTHPAIDQQVTFLYTRDLAASMRFYGETLGLPLVLDQGKCKIYRVAAGAFLGVCEDAEGPAGTPDSDVQRGVIVTLVTDEVDAWHEHLRARGVPIEKPPTLNEAFNIYHLFLRDPSGYLVELQTFRDPAWPKS